MATFLVFEKKGRFEEVTIDLDVAFRGTQLVEAEFRRLLR